MTRSLLTVSFAFLTSLFGCIDEGVDVRPPKNPREYTWTVDTLVANPSAIQTEMIDIYATSPQNVYVVGITDWSGVNGNGVMWRFNGIKWSIINQGFLDVSLGAITGFGEYNIFAAGGRDTNALILHFDGTNWGQTILPGRGLFTIRGNTPSDVWAGGWMGSLFHFDGTRWGKVDTDPRLSFKDLVAFNSHTYAIAYRLVDSPPGTILYYSLAWAGQECDTLGVYSDSSTTPSEFGLQSLSVIDGELYSAGATVSSVSSLFKLTSGRWVVVPGAIGVAKVFGTSNTNIFGGGSNGKVYQYDGSDWYQFRELEDYRFNFWTGWTNGQEVFVVGHDYRKTVVLHGM